MLNLLNSRLKVYKPLKLNLLTNQLNQFKLNKNLSQFQLPLNNPSPLTKTESLFKILTNPWMPINKPLLNNMNKFKNKPPFKPNKPLFKSNNKLNKPLIKFNNRLNKPLSNKNRFNKLPQFNPKPKFKTKSLLKYQPNSKIIFNNKHKLRMLNFNNLLLLKLNKLNQLFTLNKLPFQSKLKLLNKMPPFQTLPLKTILNNWKNQSLIFPKVLS
jgi:hypothetical protein